MDSLQIFQWDGNQLCDLIRQMEMITRQAPVRSSVVLNHTDRFTLDDAPVTFFSPMAQDVEQRRTY